MPFIIADNQDITRAGLHKYIADIFKSSPIIDVVDKKELISVLMKGHGKSIVVLDYTLFDLKGVDELLVLLHRYPEVTWILFSNELSESLMRRMSFEKSVSMILKDSSREEFYTALKSAFGGGRYHSQVIQGLLETHSTKQDNDAHLTPVEIEILRLIAQGKSAKEIAAQRNSSVHTITTHKKNIFRKIEVNTIYEATKYALKAGLIEMVEYYI
jgi:DNA-binding NarL/FixJ family response regulator